MKTRQNNSLRSLTNIKEFVDEHPKLAEVRKSGTYLELCGYIAALSAHARDQDDHRIIAEESTGTQASCRRVLLAIHMPPIARAAAAQLPLIPELAPLRMPKHGISYPRLEAAARAMATAADRHLAVFIKAGLPPDFIAQLNAAADALNAAMRRKDRSKVKVAGVTTGLASKLSRSRKLVGLLDALIRNALAGDEVQLRSWNEVKRVQKTAARTTTDTPAVAAA